jgi:hypothetical protein
MHRGLLDRIVGEPVIVPAHWPLEVGKALLFALRRGRVTAEDVYESIHDLALAQRSQLPLATLNGDLRRAAQTTGVPLIETSSAPD